MYDIKCVNGKCPICQERITITKYLRSTDYTCNNDCYEYKEGKFGTIITCDFLIYKDRYFYNNHKKWDKCKVTFDIYKQIRYWKKNDRYLMELMK